MRSEEEIKKELEQQEQMKKIALQRLPQNKFERVEKAGKLKRYQARIDMLKWVLGANYE